MYNRHIIYTTLIFIRLCVNGTFNVNLCQTNTHDTIYDRFWQGRAAHRQP
jgi:hypothetical protein